MVQGPWCKGYGARAMVQAPWCNGHGARAMVQGRWCKGDGAGAMVQAPWCEGQGVGGNSKAHRQRDAEDEARDGARRANGQVDPIGVGTLALRHLFRQLERAAHLPEDACRLRAGHARAAQR
eukprot:2966059-Prymnesium_polylepis.1